MNTVSCCIFSNYSVEGYYGNFATQSAAGLKESTAIFLDMGDDFSYSGEVNADVLEAVNMTDSADKSEVRQKLFFGSFYRDPWANSYNPTRGSRRQL